MSRQERATAAPRRRRLTRKPRKAAIALMTAILLVVLLAVIALAIDIGYIMLTQTQLQAAADAATLSGGTELLGGLGVNPVSPEFVVAAGTQYAMDYAAKNPNGDLAGSYCDGSRDVRFGWAVYDSDATPPRWMMHWGEQIPDVGGYNLIGVTLRRDQTGSTKGDRPLPLFFAPAIGHQFNHLAKDAAAVIMPANGIRIEPGNTTSTSNIVPFAVNKSLWEKYLRAQAHYDANNHTFPNPVTSVTDDVTGEPLYGHFNTDPNQITTFVQDFRDDWGCNCTAKTPVAMPEAGGDGVLEVDIFPRDDYTAGNLGTVDFGSAANDTKSLSRQIRHGANATDLSYYEGNQFTLPRISGGETGLSAGIKDDLEAILGVCRVVFLFDGLTNQGDTTEFSLMEMAGVRLMNVELTGQLEFKHLSIQRCDATLQNGTADYDQQIGENTTVFTPLILIE